MDSERSEVNGREECVVTLTYLLMEAARREHEETHTHTHTNR